MRESEGLDRMTEVIVMPVLAYALLGVLTSEKMNFAENKKESYNTFIRHFFHIVTFLLCFNP